MVQVLKLKMGCRIRLDAHEIMRLISWRSYGSAVAGVIESFVRVIFSYGNQTYVALKYFSPPDNLTDNDAVPH